MLWTRTKNRYTQIGIFKHQQKDITTVAISTILIQARTYFPSIQAAIDDSDTKSGHTITVDPGTYVDKNNTIDFVIYGIPTQRWLDRYPNKRDR